MRLLAQVATAKEQYQDELLDLEETENQQEEAAKAAEEMKAKKEGTATAEEKSGEGADGEEVKEGEMETIVAGGRRDIMVGEDFRRRVNKIC